VGQRADAECDERLVGIRADQRQQRPVGGDVGRLDAHEEAHPVEEVTQRPAWPGSTSEPGGRAVVGDQGVLLDVPVRREQQQFGAGGKAGEVWVVRLCSQLNRSSPGTATTPRWDRSTRADRGREGALLAHRVAVVRDHTGRRDCRGRGRRRGRRSFRTPAHTPNRATWPMSTWKPRLSASVATRPSRTAGDTS
jgi:hypothetical protein